jgi:hypothetical protein
VRCLFRRSEVASGLINAHNLNIDRTHARQEKLSDEHYVRVRESVEMQEAIIATATLLINDLVNSLEPVEGL